MASIWVASRQAGLGQIEVEEDGGIGGRGHLNRQHRVVGGLQTGDPQGQAVAIENLGKTLPHHRPNPPAHQRLGRMLATGTAAEIAIHQQDRRIAMFGPIEGVAAAQLGAIVGEHLLAQSIEGHALEKAGRNDPIGVDVVAAQHQGRAHDAINRTGGEGSRHLNQGANGVGAEGAVTASWRALKTAAACAHR